MWRRGFKDKILREVLMKKPRHLKKTGKKPKQKNKYPLRGKPIIYRDPFKSVDLEESQVSTRIPGVDKGKVIIMPDFDEPLPEFDE
jgi:hypothetical protein